MSAKDRSHALNLVVAANDSIRNVAGKLRRQGAQFDTDGLTFTERFTARSAGTKLPKRRDLNAGEWETIAEDLRRAIHRLDEAALFADRMASR